MTETSSEKLTNTENLLLTEVIFWCNSCLSVSYNEMVKETNNPSTCIINAISATTAEVRLKMA